MKRVTTESVSSLGLEKARHSLQSIVGWVDTEEAQRINDRSWRWSYIKEQFSTRKLENLFMMYTHKINHGYFSLFLILQFFIDLAHFLLVIFSNYFSKALYDEEQRPLEYLLNVEDNNRWAKEHDSKDIYNEILLDLILYGITTIMPVIGLFISEKYIGKDQNRLRILSLAAFLIFFVMDIIIPIFYANSNGAQLRPAYTTNLILACYIFFHIYKTYVSAILGFSVAIVHVLITYFISYRNSEHLYNRIGAEIMYLFCINSLGIYFKLVNEIVMRKSFLDRRACVDSTLRLKFETEQANQLLQAIIPEYVLVDVRDKITEIIKTILDNKGVGDELLYLTNFKPYDNVTILYADIVNYTKMTSNLPAYRLVEILDDLFAKFDDASEVHDVMRIKFLGDCYYCVSGLPPKKIKHHAEACVDLGLVMIDIIRKVRERRGLDIDMRIGIHTGSIVGGLIGNRKWQFDIWSTDVGIANKMETTGTAGKVHITRQTKEQLKKNYNITKSDKASEDDFLKANNIEGFLISPDKSNRRSTMRSIKSPTLSPTKHFPHFPNGINSNASGSTSENNPDQETVGRRNSLYIPHNSVRSPRFSTLQNGFNSNPGGSTGEDNGTESPRDSLYNRHSVIRPPRFSPFQNGFNGSLDDSIAEDNPDLEIGRRRDSIFLTQNKLNSNANRFHNKNDRRHTPAERRFTPDSKRRTAFMDNNLNRFNESLKDTDKAIKEEIESMPLSKTDQWFNVRDIHPFLLLFRDIGIEKKYIKQPDPLFKYYMISQVFVLISIVVIQLLIFPRWSWTSSLTYGMMAVVIFLFLPLTWTQYIWVGYRGENKEPKKTINLMFNCSRNITNNFALRFLIYIILCLISTAYIVSELLKCVDSQSDLILYIKRSFRLSTSKYQIHEECLIPWHMTDICSLVLMLSFVFLRIHLWLKAIFSAAISVFYCYFIIYSNQNLYKNSESFNYRIEPYISHILSIATLMFTLHLIDRQTDYMNRLDYQWSNKLKAEEAEKNIMHGVNSTLLSKILPTHVAKLYLDMKRKPTGLYVEEYTNVAVMFASIRNYTVADDKTLLTLMHTIIRGFDNLIFYHPEVEKIKIANWTYMAACGLITEAEIEDTDEEPIFELVKFAVAMMNALNEINRSTGQQITLRIGISHGELTAGVVGSKKPLYDIWGDTVNMASRMDSTGEDGRIQVSENSAKVLQAEGYICDYRGKIYVKGKSAYPGAEDIPTYFVKLNKKNKNKIELVRNYSNTYQI